MPSTTDSEDLKGLFALFKGDSGAGKTVGALSFPNPYHFDLDRKMPAIAKKHFHEKKIDYDTFDTIFELRDKLSAFKEECSYDTLVIDSLTALNQLIIHSMGILKNEETMQQFDRMLHSTSGAKTTLREAQRKDIAVAVDTMTIDYYNGSARFIQNYFFDELKKLWARPGKPYHVIVIAHVMTKTSNPDLKTKIVTETRSIVTAGKQISAYIPTVYDEVYQFAVRETDAYAGEISRICCTQAVGEDSAKTAYNFPSRIDFTNKSLYEQLRGIASFPE